MSDSLNVIALISGGKDSLYSLLHCIQNGHKIIALANLYPPLQQSVSDDEEGEDLNSFMYQTVGHSVIPFYAEALQLPLFRREITGSAIETGRYYRHNSMTSAHVSALDETEDLIPLLQEVLATYPQANAISTGAIQSTYQRTRVESIALRLGLTPLAYLWQYPVLPPPLSPETGEKARDESVAGLLDDMAAAGCQSRIIKIASGGIRESLLWSDVTDNKTRMQLVAGLQRYFEDDVLGLRGAVVGEGGEFETLALCGPPRIWTGGKIVFEQDDITTYSGDGGTSYVKLKGARLSPWSESEPVDNGSQTSLVRIPSLFDEQFEIIKKTISKLARSRKETDTSDFSALSLTEHTSISKSSIVPPRLSYAISSSVLQVANVTNLSHESRAQERQTASEQMESIASLVPDILFDISMKHNITPHLNTSNIVATTLLLRDMADFTFINPIYGSIFQAGVPNPPARITISAPLPEGIDVMLSFIADLGSTTNRRGLHVQSRSYWAPANIGPYSQAITVPLRNKLNVQQEDGNVEVVYVAGQIPLEPASMNLLVASYAEQTILSLQHLWRIGQEMKVEFWMFAVTFLRHENSDAVIKSKVDTAAMVWAEVHSNAARRFAEDQKTQEDEDEDEVDVWHLQNNRGSHAPQKHVSAIPNHLHPLPTIRRIMHSDELDLFLPPFIAAEVTALPRNASTEWWSTGIARLRSEEIYTISNVSRPEENWSITRVRHTKSNPNSWSVFVTYVIPKNSTASSVSSTNESFKQALYKELKIEPAEAVMTHGTALVAEYGQANWKETLSSLSNILTETMSSCHVGGQEKLQLADTVATIPCYRLWGHVGIALPGHDACKELSSPPVHMLDTALLLRIDST